MTDKQIIIDGVDVSECIECNTDKIKDGYDALCCLTNCSCKHHPYCDYKKLKRKEQQIENLNKLTEQQRKDNINLTTKLGERILKNGELYNQLKAKEQECEKWKQIANEYEQRWLNSYGV